MNIKYIHPLTIILVGMYIVSMGFNVLMYSENKRLIEELKQKPKVIIIPLIQEKPKQFTNV